MKKEVNQLPIVYPEDMKKKRGKVLSSCEVVKKRERHPGFPRGINCCLKRSFKQQNENEKCKMRNNGMG